MTTLLFANNASSTLAGPISSSATSVTLASGTGALFPQPTAGQAFKLTFVSASNPNTREIVLCTAVVGDTLTIVRGQESTTPASWSAGDFANHWLTAGSFVNFLQSGAFYLGSDTGTANAASVSSWTPTLTSVAVGNMLLVIKSAAANTGAMTLNGLPLNWVDGTALQAGDWPAGTPALVFAEGTTSVTSYAILSMMGPTVFARATSAAATNIVVYSTPGTYSWTVPAGVTLVKRIRLWGAGGGGGYGNGSTGAGGGAGGGSYSEKLNLSVTPGATVTVVVGAAGLGATVAGNAGANGGASSFGAAATAGGGAGGAAGNSSVGSGGAGGTATGGMLNLSGYGGENGLSFGAAGMGSGVGGGAPFGAPNNWINLGTAGNNGGLPGGGGNGGSNTNAGGNGGAGMVVIEY